MMYTEHAFLDRFAAAARDGFRAVEFLFPYDFPAATIAKALHEHGLQQVLFNAPPGDFGGRRARHRLPGRARGRVPERHRARARYAAALRCPRVHVMAGLAPAGVDRARAARPYVANLALGRGARGGAPASTC